MSHHDDAYGSESTSSGKERPILDGNQTSRNVRAAMDAYAEFKSKQAKESEQLELPEKWEARPAFVIESAWRTELIGRIAALENAIRKHRDQKGDDRCWQDDEELYKALPEGYTPPLRSSAVELAMCEKYIACRHNPVTEYISPQRRIEELESALETIRDGFDCDNDAHKYGTTCRCCLAEEVLSGTT